MLEILQSNEILFFLQIIVSFTGLLIAFKFFDSIGMFAWIAFMTIYANIEVNSFCEMFGLTVSLGNVAFVSLGLAQYIISERSGYEASKKSVHLGFFTAIVVTIFSMLSMKYNCIEGSTHEAFCIVFGGIGAIVISSLISYFCSNRLNVFIYEALKKVTNKLWIKAQVSTWISQTVDSFLFTGLCIGSTILYNNIGIDFFNTQFPVSWNIYVELSLTTLAIKLIAGLFEVPFLYIAKRMFNN